MDKLQSEIKLENGKYTFQLFQDGTFRCLRYDETWRDFTGDKAVFALFCAFRDSQILAPQEERK